MPVSIQGKGVDMEPEDDPKGTMVILLIFMVVLALSWGGIYLLMLQRAGG